METKPLVLVVGSAGRIGKAVVAELKSRHVPVRGFDLVPTPGLPESYTGSILDPAALKPAMAGVDVLIHLAATPDDVEDVLGSLIPNNIIGLYHVLETARAAGVKRLILASSGQVNWWQRKTGPIPVTADHPASPRYWYGASKMFMESIGRGFAESHGMSVIIARLGWCPRTREQVEEIGRTDWAQDVYISPHDVGQFFALAALAPDIQFQVLYATSRHRKTYYYDLEPAKQLIGYEPRDQWPQGVDQVLADQPQDRGAYPSVLVGGRRLGDSSSEP